MRIMGWLSYLIMTLLICVGTGVAQEQPLAPTALSSKQGFETVYIYRLDEGTVVLGFLHQTRPIYFREHRNGKQQKNMKIAGLRNKHYLMLQLPPGKYIFDTRLMWNHLELEVTGGGVYYLRVDQGNDCPSEEPNSIYNVPCESKSASVEEVSPERWRKDMSALQPIKSGDVKNRGLVMIPPGTPSNAQHHSRPVAIDDKG